MTYSIVARDRRTGQLGVAVQSGTLGAGSIVPWAQAGVGAVATQAFADPAYGPRCLAALAAGKDPGQALDEALAEDPANIIRQVGVVSADGKRAAFTGAGSIAHAGHQLGEGFTVQANMMASPEVWPAMAEAFVGTGGALAGRMMAALDAAQAAGGDGRGVMSAGMLVVDGQPGEPWSGRLLDLRVDHSADPLGELRRLLAAADAYQRFNVGVSALVNGDADTALTEIDAGLAELPGDVNLRFLRAGALAGRGDLEAARSEVRSLLGDQPGWAIVMRGVAEKGLLPLPDGVTIEDLITG